ncbi:MAG: C39 family peptidase [Gemmatimonadota bacterium]|jgi:hypothetical protein
MKVRACVLAVGLAVTVSACDSSIFSSDGPSDAPVVLSVPYRAQQTQVWCWAATSEMVLAYYDVNIPQCEILSAWMQTNCCVVNPVCERTASLQVMQGTLNYFGGLESYISGALTFDQVRTEIDAGRPLILAYSNSFAAHVVVLYGYDPRNASVYVHDPYFGSFNPPYGSSFNYGGTMYWYQTIAGIRR